MKAAIQFSLLTGLLIAGLADGLSGLQARLEATSMKGLDASVQQEFMSTSRSFQANVSRTVSAMGNEAAGPMEEEQQFANRKVTAAPEVQLEHVRRLFKPSGSGMATVLVQGQPGEKYGIEIFDLSGHRVLYREGILDVSEREVTLNFTHAAEGIYFVKVKAGGRSESMRYLNQRIS